LPKADGSGETGSSGVLAELPSLIAPGWEIRESAAVQGVPHFVRVLIGSNPFSAPCSSDAPELAKLIE
jgi:hypothetical protein